MWMASTSTTARFAELLGNGLTRPRCSPKVLGPQNKLEKVKYFTARVQPSPRDPNVNVRQDAYLRALQAHCRLVELHFGRFLRHRILSANPPPPTLEVWKNEEKGSDVSLALHVLNDA